MKHSQPIGAVRVHTTKCYLIDPYRAISALIMAFIAWKLVRHARPGMAEKAGRSVDAALAAAAHKVETSANALQAWADGGMGEHVGKGLDQTLAEAKKTIEIATETVDRVLHRAKPDQQADSPST